MPDPEYNISIQSGYVLVEDPPEYDVVWGEQTAKLKAIAAACAEAGCKTVLIRGSKANVKLSTIQIHDLGKEVGKLNLKIAVVTSHDAPWDEVILLEATAKNRGSPIRFFHREKDAKEWLEG